MYKKLKKSVALAAFYIFSANSEAAKISYLPSLPIFLGGVSSYSVANNATGITATIWDAVTNYEPDFKKPIKSAFIQRYSANGNPLGKLIQIDRSCLNMGCYDIFRPKIAIGLQGQFIAAWDGGTKVFAQLYDATGKMIKDIEITNGLAPILAMDDTGNFVISWESTTGNLYARRYNATGEPTTNEFIVTTHPIDQFVSASIAMNSDGQFALAWQHPRTTDCVASAFSKSNKCDDIVLRRYNNQAVPQGPEMIIATSNNNLDQNPSIAMDNNGNFAVAWQRYRDVCQNLLECDDIEVKYYNATGVATNTIDVSADDTHTDVTPHIAMSNNGKFVVIWQRLADIAPSVDDIAFKAYDASGVSLTDTTLQTVTANMISSSQRNTDPVIDISDKGDLNVIWTTHTLSYLVSQAPAPTTVYRRLKPSMW